MKRTRDHPKIVKSGNARAVHRLPPGKSVKGNSNATPRSLVIDPGLDKLQELLLAMAPGDEVSVARATEVSGLNQAQCDAVFDALMRAGFMVRLGQGAYARCQLDVMRQAPSTQRRAS
jgi:hypothetical protein